MNDFESKIKTFGLRAKDIKDSLLNYEIGRASCRERV